MNIFKFLILDNIVDGCLALLLLCGCNKQWLDAKPDLKLVVPNSVKDYQAILDNDNSIFNIELPALGEVGSADFTISSGAWSALPTNQEKYAYLWDRDIYRGNINVADWNSPYKAVFTANLVLEGAGSLTTEEDLAALNNIKGSALFLRALSFYTLAQLFTKPYDQATASHDRGVILKLHSNVNEKLSRASVQQTYDQITSDLLAAGGLLPALPLYKTRPSQAAVYGLLARVYLTMGNYRQGYRYADSCLKVQSGLMDYNQLDPSKTRPIAKLNEEVIFQAILNNYSIFSLASMNIDSSLLSSYQSNDLRRNIFFVQKGAVVNYRGSYFGAKPLFGGLATDEILLIRAECAVRLGQLPQAISDLNTLLEKRWVAGTYKDYQETDGHKILAKILTERRKELCFRGLRWTDLRRLNTDSRFAQTLTRTLDNQTYTLLPQGAAYVLPIPDDVIRLGGIEQNPR